MSTGDTPRVLGTLAGLDEPRLEAGVILWDRFAVVGVPIRSDATTVITVTDLERKLGAETHYKLDVHLLPTPGTPRDEARLGRAIAVKSRVQPEVFAIGRAGDRMLLICAPTIGHPLDMRAVDSPSPTLSRRKLVAYGTELAGLLAELHAADVRGVRFTRDMLRVEDGHVGVDRFTHLLASQERHDDAERDVAALIELLRELGDPKQAIEFGPPRSAAQLHAQLRELGDVRTAVKLPSDPPFIGRTRALGELARGLDQAHIAQPTALVLRGQRGVGKSRLLNEFVAGRLAADDSLVLHGAWQERSADSRGGLLSALDQLPQMLADLELDERDDIRRRIDRATRHLGAIVTRSAPALGSVLRNVEELPPLELGEDFSRHTAVIADLLRSLGTQKRPLVLVLDNLESVDASSAAVLKILTQHRPAHHTLVVMGLRSDSAYKPEFEFEAVELAPLSAGEIEQLLIEVLPGEIAESEAVGHALWSISGGLPLAAWTNLRAWLDRGRLSRSVEDGVWRTRGRVRDDSTRLEVYDVFGARLRAASDQVREVALRVAVLGTELGADDLAALAADDPDHFGAAIEDLVGRNILTRTNAGVRFPHDSIRELVFESFDEDHRRDAHAFAAAVRTKQKAPTAQIAYHRDLALDPGASADSFDRLSRLHVDAGRERLAVYDLERARWHLERALEHSRDPDQRNIAAEGLADICLLLDDVDTAVSLYTAIIATAAPAHAVATAAKSVSFLWSKSSNVEARQLGYMALEVVHEPAPTTPFGKLMTMFGAILRSWLGRKPKHTIEIREALCRLYPWLTLISLIDDPVAMPMYVARSHWIARGLTTAAASMVHSIEGSMWASLGFFAKANRIFTLAYEIAVGANDPWAQGWAKHYWGHVSLLPSDRYEDGQDMLDDAIAAFRETGDVSLSILALMFKGLYGRDREPSDVVLGWFDEGTAMARRNGKFVATSSLEALKLQVLARQGRTDLEPRIVALSKQLDVEDISGIERLMARVYLAFAAYESKQWNVAVEQVRKGQSELGDLPGVPEYCSEIHLVSALVMLERPMATAKDRKLLRQATRKFRAAAKRSPRLRVVGEYFEMVLAVHAGDSRKAQTIASKIVAEMEEHGNLYVARQAHLALSRILKGENVLAAAEHDRVARNLGRRLGIHDRAMLSEFSDMDQDVGLLALGIDNSIKLEESQHDIPAAGMLTSEAPAKPKRTTPKKQVIDEQTDVLEAWALTSVETKHTNVADMIEPVREAVSSSIEPGLLVVENAQLDVDIPIGSGDLQIVLINLLLTCSDAAGGNARIDIRFEARTFGETATEGPSSDLAPTRPGRYLVVSVTAPSPPTRVPILGGFAACDRLVQSIGGQLHANTNRKQIALTALIPIETERSSLDDLF